MPPAKPLTNLQTKLSLIDDNINKIERILSSEEASPEILDDFKSGFELIAECEKHISGIRTEIDKIQNKYLTDSEYTE